MDRKEDLRRFVEQQVGVSIKDNSEFFTDLGISGLDADSFINSLIQKYGIDFSAFESSKYYFSEYELGNIFLMVFRIIFKNKKVVKSSFTFEHLYNVVEKGEWFEP